VLVDADDKEYIAVGKKQSSQVVYTSKQRGITRIDFVSGLRDVIRTYWLSPCIKQIVLFHRLLRGEL
jgi:hypothetical protein